MSPSWGLEFQEMSVCIHVHICTFNDQIKYFHNTLSSPLNRLYVQLVERRVACCVQSRYENEDEDEQKMEKIFPKQNLKLETNLTTF